MLTPRHAIQTAAALALLACLSCQNPVKTQSHRTGSVSQHVAVLPLQIAERLNLPEDEAAVAAQIVAHQLAEALTRRGVQVVAPSDVAHFFATPAAAAPAPPSVSQASGGRGPRPDVSRSPKTTLPSRPSPPSHKTRSPSRTPKATSGRGPRPPREVAQQLAAEFGADAVLFGVLTRWEEREGTGAGAMHAAAVGFEVLLRSAPSGERLWSGYFDHRQQPLGENLLVTSRYPGGGTRWLSAPELARWGAGEVARRIPLH